MDATLVNQSESRRQGFRNRLKTMAERTKGSSVPLSTVMWVALPLASAIWFVADMHATLREQGKALSFQQSFSLAMREDIAVITTYYQRMQVDLAARGIRVESLPPLKSAIMNPSAPAEQQDQHNKP